MMKVDDGYRWQRPLILRTFNQKDAEKILDIPISILGREDSNYWLHSGNGNYTVKSGYKELCRGTTEKEGRRGNEEETSLAKSNRGIWKNLWKLIIKSKLKHFIWRCANGVLPVNGLIYRRTHKGDPICEGCGKQEESIEHVFFHCRRAQEVWKMAPIQWDGITEQTWNFLAWWNAIMEATRRRNGRDHVELTVSILRQI